MNNKIFDLNSRSLNFGPQHPAAHGVLRLVVERDGEFIINIDPHIGLLHRGTEKLIEYKNFLQALPYFDRLDYVSRRAQEHCFSRIIEKILNWKIDLDVSYIRVIFLEITRILNHILALTTHALDVGALTPFLWGFEEREKLREFYERVSGARRHAAFIRPGGISNSLPLNLLEDIWSFLNKFKNRIDEIDNLLSSNRIWNDRLSNVGIVKASEAISFGFTGVRLRGSGINWDLRINNTYEIYDKLNFVIPVGIEGDCFDRFKLRLEEIRSSIDIIYQCISFLINKVYVNNYNYKFGLISRVDRKNSRESLIHHFKYYTEGKILTDSNIYCAVEAPKGEFGIHLITNNTNRPFRCKIRAPGFFHLQGLNFIARGALLADLVTIIGTLDLVLGEIDR